ncbi:hypothetical protein CCACVL1_04108, partial [Corchorus capsularis]
ALRFYERWLRVISYFFRRRSRFITGLRENRGILDKRETLASSYDHANYGKLCKIYASEPVPRG